MLYRGRKIYKDTSLVWNRQWVLDWYGGNLAFDRRYEAKAFVDFMFTEWGHCIPVVIGSKPEDYLKFPNLEALPSSAPGRKGK